MKNLGTFKRGGLMRKISLLLVVLFVVLVFSGITFAATYTGEYVGVFNGNDVGAQGTGASEIVNHLSSSHAINIGVNNVSILSKVPTQDGQSWPTSGPLVVTDNNGSAITGKVTYGNWTSTTTIYFYTIKAGNGFELYHIEGGASSGTWAIQDLKAGNNNQNTPGISHFTTWTYESAVPIPPSVILFGSGLIGVVGLTRRRKQTV